MPHLNREPGGVDLTASAYIVRTDFDEPKIMLHWHRKLNAYMQFGGHVESSENLWQAVIHEVREEAGYDMDQLAVLQQPHRITELPDNKFGLSRLHPTPLVLSTHRFIDENDPELIDHFHTDVAFAFVTDEPPHYKPEAGESEDLQVYSLAELQELKDILPDVQAISTLVLKEALPHWERVSTDAWL